MSKGAWLLLSSIICWAVIIGLFWFVWEALGWLLDTLGAILAS